MKRLHLIRHAKSSWKEIGLADYDRPLNKRGKRNAPFIAQYLSNEGVMADFIISSPAKRTKMTTDVLHVCYPEVPILYCEALYEASLRDILGVLHGIPEQMKNVFLIGHNPGFNSVADHLIKGGFGANIPTMGVVSITFKGPWCDIREDAGRLERFIYPKLFSN